MEDKAPLFKPGEDWENVRKWIEKDDAVRTTLMRSAIQQEFKKGFVPISNRLSALTIAFIIFTGIEVGATLFLFVKLINV